MSIANIHAGCVAIGRHGVLLLGESGAGKSDLALRLIDDGARLVADDRCDLFVQGGRLRVRPPASIAGLIELAGIGILRMPWRKDVALAMAVRLGEPAARLPEPAFYAPPGTLETARPVPLIVLNGAAPSAAARVRAALTGFTRAAFRDTLA